MAWVCLLSCCRPRVPGNRGRGCVLSGWEGAWNIFLSKQQQLMWFVETEVKKLSHILALWLGSSITLETNPSIHFSRQAVLKREMVVCPWQNPPVAPSVRSHLRGKLKSYSAGPLFADQVKLSLSPCGFWLHSPIPEIPDFAVDSTAFPYISPASSLFLCFHS